MAITEQTLDLLEARRDAALRDLAEKHLEFYDHGEGTKEIITALDAVTMAHLAAMFKWANGPHKRLKNNIMARRVRRRPCKC
jgi:hypothetical protein